MYDIWRNYEIFATLTYSRDESLRTRWLQVTEDSNRFIQRLQRKNRGSYLEYLRIIEPHKDGYPHLHLHIRIGSDYQVRDRKQYLYDYVRTCLKSISNDFGITDFQCPKHSGTYTIGYVTKYLGKSTSLSSLWQLILNPTFKPYTPPISDEYPDKQVGVNIWKLISTAQPENLICSPLRWKRIKLATWSRGYASTFGSGRLATQR